MTQCYDFDRVHPRRHTDCVKYDCAQERMGKEELIPLWVADMDFALPQEILDDLHRRIDHGIFGYTMAGNAYAEAIDHWFSTRHGYHVPASWIVGVTGVVEALTLAVLSFSDKGDRILIQEPVYHPFRELIESNERICINAPLIEQAQNWYFDLEAFEKAIIEHQVKVFILCNPHNPVGRVWTRSELEDLTQICLRHKVLILSDEIHCDFAWGDNRVTSVATLDEAVLEHALIFTSPTKTFNIAGLKAAQVFIPNETLRSAFQKTQHALGASAANLMGLTATISCYTKGAPWLDALLEYLEASIAYTKAYIAEHIPYARATHIQGTYLLWVDFSGYELSKEELNELIVEKAGVWLNAGSIFSVDTPLYQRINLACPRATLQKGLEALAKAFSEVSVSTS